MNPCGTLPSRTPVTVKTLGSNSMARSAEFRPIVVPLVWRNITGTVSVEPGDPLRFWGSQTRGSGPPWVMVTPGRAGMRGWGTLATNCDDVGGVQSRERTAAGDIGQDRRVEQREGGEAGVDVGHHAGDQGGVEAAVAAVAGGVAEVGDDVDAVVVGGGDGPAVDARCCR